MTARSASYQRHAAFVFDVEWMPIPGNDRAMRDALRLRSPRSSIRIEINQIDVVDAAIICVTAQGIPHGFMAAGT